MSNAWKAHIHRHEPEKIKNLIWKLAFCFQNCLLWEKILKFKAEGQEFAKYLGSLEQFLSKVKGNNNCSLRYLRSNTFEQLEFKFKKIIGI